MSLTQRIQQAWQNQSTWLIVLRPLSWLYRAIFLWQKSQKLKTAYRAKIPVMIIGNITVGGSGKTPLIIHLVKYLQQRGVRVGVISRGYGGRGHFPCLVNTESTPYQVGDEPMLIYQETQVPMAVGSKRGEVIDLLLQHHDLQLILSDDGLQHFALQRDIEWVVLDVDRGLGNQKLLPEGFLREPVERLKEVTVIEHGQNAHSSYSMTLGIGQPFCLGDENQSFDENKQHQTWQAVVGIGYPQRFLNTLDGLHLNYQPHIFADHHQYQYDDLSHILRKGSIMTTSKDAVKMQALYAQQPEILQKIWVVPVEAMLSSACYPLLWQQLAQHQIFIEDNSLK